MTDCRFFVMPSDGEPWAPEIFNFLLGRERVRVGEIACALSGAKEGSTADAWRIRRVLLHFGWTQRRGTGGARWYERPEPTTPRRFIKLTVFDQCRCPVVWVARSGPDGAALPPRRMQRFACDACGQAVEVSAYPRVRSFEEIAQVYRRHGWLMNETEALFCPDCRRAARRKPQKQDDDMAKAATVKTPVPPLVVGVNGAIGINPAIANGASSAAIAAATAHDNPVPSAQASRAMVELYVMLEDAYDRDKRDYRAGWDDERVARETRLSVSVVRARREQDFGPLAPAPSADELRAQVAKLADAMRRRHAGRSLGHDLARIARDLSGLAERVRDDEAAFSRYALDLDSLQDAVARL